MKRAFLDNWKIDGVAMLSPDDGGLTVKRKNLLSSDSGDDEGGFYHPIVLRADVKEWEFLYSALTGEEYDYMENLFLGKSKFELTCEDGGSVKTYTAHRKSSSAVWKSRITGEYRNYGFTIIEC